MGKNTKQKTVPEAQTSGTVETPNVGTSITETTNAETSTAEVANVGTSTTETTNAETSTTEVANVGTSTTETANAETSTTEVANVETLNLTAANSEKVIGFGVDHGVIEGDTSVVSISFRGKNYGLSKRMPDKLKVYGVLYTKEELLTNEEAMISLILGDSPFIQKL